MILLGDANPHAHIHTLLAEEKPAMHQQPGKWKVKGSWRCGSIHQADDLPHIQVFAD